MTDRKWFVAKLAEVTRRKEKCLADYNALLGAEQFCQQAIKEIDEELGLPLETLFPGATVETPPEGS